ncbi:uncharacterized protein LOC130736746 [Lotus japonicus]|uniref:uncharacterized protein LOC130736746 n=1 Tax=Lotus japonicus TaxID=34305 RepID=UPI00258A9F8E|nr:uncharacterized protein LOC130736746 [Lotus japonicus]
MDLMSTQTEPLSSTVWKSNSELIDGLFVPPNAPKNLNKLLRKQFNMLAQTITPELQKDLKLLKMETVVDSPLDFFSGRLTKERKSSLADELLSGQNLAAYWYSPRESILFESGTSISWWG